MIIPAEQYNNCHQLSTTIFIIMTNVLRAKLLMLGDSCVGKTAIIQQFINSGAAFPKNYSMTLGADVQTKTINIPDTSDVVELTMIDCSGKTINNDILTKLAQGTSLVVAGETFHFPLPS